MTTTERSLYPKQKKIEPLKKKEETVKSSPSIVERDGRHSIAINESEADSYLPRAQRPSLTKKEEKEVSQNARQLLFGLAGAPQPNAQLENPADDQHEDTNNKFSKFKKLELDGFTSLAEATSWCARVFWLILLIFVLGVLTFMIYRTVNDYIENKVITTYTVTRNDSLKFPILYICPGNYLNDTYYRTHVRESLTATSFQVSLLNQSNPTAADPKRPKREIKIVSLDNYVKWQNELLAENGFQNIKYDPESLDYNDETEWPEGLYDGEMEHKRVERDTGNFSMSNFTLPLLPLPKGNGTTSNGTAIASLPLLNMTADEVYDFMLQVGYDKSQVFLSCKFYENGQQKPLWCDDIVSDAVDVNYGKCYKVSVGDLQQSVEARGLSLIIDTFRSRITKDPTASKRYNGMFLAVHYDTLNPASWEKILVGGGTYMNLDISLEHIQLVNVDRSDFHQPCIESDENLLNVLNVTYSQTACQLDCFLRQVVDICHCVLMMDRSYILNDILVENKFCSKEDGLRCILPKITNDPDATVAVKKCESKCHVPCDSWRYKVNPSSMVLNPLAFDDLPTNITYNDILQLDVSYSRLEYVEFTQSLQTTLDTFIGNLGGQITGWVGGSMLTIIHIPILLSKYLVSRSVKRAKTMLFTQSSQVEKSVVGFQNIIQAQQSFKRP